MRRRSGRVAIRVHCWTRSLAGLAFLACGRPQPETPADLIITNARVYTFGWADPSPDGAPAPGAPHGASGWSPDAQTIAIQAGRIRFVGDQAGATTYRGPATRVVDAQGATVLPGLVDSHTHIAELGANLTRVSLVGISTEADAVAKIAEVAAKTPRGEWIQGYGWDEGAWANHYPTTALLSQKVPNHPVYLRGLHGFAVWGNRLAFAKAGITGSTTPPVGGEIVRDAGGQPTGILKNRAVALLEAAVPPPTLEQLKTQLVTALDALGRAGYVAVHEAGTPTDELAALEALEDEGKLPLRVYAMLSARDTALARRWIARGPVRDASRMLRVASVKAFYDGALGSRGARLLADYSDLPGHRGLSGSGYGFDQKLMAQLMKAGFQASVHAIGDAGNRETLEFFESVYRQNPETRSQRNRIEHAQVVHPDDFARFARDSIIASMEPPHAVEDKAWAEARLGPDRIKGAYAWRSMRRKGVRLVFNSDLPGSDYSAFYGLHAAVTRRDRQLEPREGWFPEQRVTPEEALRAYSTWGAYAAFVERETGILAPGRWADLTMMDIDPLAVGEKDPGKLLDGKIVMTVGAGKGVYEARKQ